MGADLEILPLDRGRRGDLDRFIKVAFDVYRHDPLWVAPILYDHRKVFTDVNPLFQHARMRLWVARRAGRDVGRIVGLIDDVHNGYHKEKTAFFGFFECLDDATVAAALFDAAADWAKRAGMNRLLGPMNPTTNDECGLLVEGFDSSPVFMMTYNPRYYMDLLGGAGFVKAKDLLAYRFDITPEPAARLSKIAAGLRRRNPDITVRNIRRKTLRDDLGKVREIYNAAWSENWCFVPMTDGDIDFMASRLKDLLDENLAWLAETAADGPVAFMLSSPDYNEPFKPLRGRLLTPRLIAALPQLLRWKATRFARVMTLGVKKPYRQRGIEAVMFADSLAYALNKGFKQTEVSWMLEDNLMVLRHAEVFKGSLYKRYRIYERPVGR